VIVGGNALEKKKTHAQLNLSGCLENFAVCLEKKFKAEVFMMLRVSSWMM